MQCSIIESMNDEERWLPAVGYEGLYEVSNHGRVRSLDKVVRGSYGSKMLKRSCVRKLHKTKDGYMSLQLMKDGKRRYRLVHRLVLESFVGPCPPGYECRHFPDKDPANNRLTNLSWGTPQQNGRDKTTHGTGVGEHNHKSRLTEEQVLEMRRLGAQGVRNVDLAPMFDVDVVTVSHVLVGRTWRHLPGAIGAKTRRGASHCAAKLTPEDVREIRALVAQGALTRGVGMRYGIHQASVSRIVHHRHWSDEVDELRAGG